MIILEFLYALVSCFLRIVVLCFAFKCLKFEWYDLKSQLCNNINNNNNNNNNDHRNYNSYLFTKI
jgi:hypothetical protein